MPVLTYTTSCKFLLLNPKHYDSLINYALNLGLKNGFIQEEGTDTISYVPKFNCEGV